MVTTLNITLEDDIAERARSVKEDRGLTWGRAYQRRNNADETWCWW